MEAVVGMRNADEFRLRPVDGITQDPPAVGTVRIHAATAIFAARAGGDAGDQDMITSLEAAHRSAHLFDDPDTFMAENPARLASGEIGRATSELQSLMRISYAVFCLKEKTQKTKSTTRH